MIYFYLCLSLIPNFIVIGFLFFNKNVRKKYNTKKVIYHLLGMMFGMIILFGMNMRFYSRLENGSGSILQYILLSIFFCTLFSMPVFILMRHKTEKTTSTQDNNKSKKILFQLIFGFLVAVALFSSIFFTITLK